MVKVKLVSVELCKFIDYDGDGKKFYAYDLQFFIGKNRKSWHKTVQARLPIIDNLEAGDEIFYDEDKGEISLGEITLDNKWSNL